MNTEIETPVIYDNDILLAKLDKAGLDILINILKDTFKCRISNMKSSSIPLQKRRDLIIKTILEHIVKSPDETLSRKILDTHFPEKVSIKRDASWLDEFEVDEILLVYSNHDHAYIKARILKINKASLTVKMYSYTKILDTDAIQNQTYGNHRLVWENPEDQILHQTYDTKCLRSRNGFLKFGESKWRDDEFVEGKQRCDFGH